MKFGMKVTKIHGALKFLQSLWMKNYIEENIRKRKIANKDNRDEFGVSGIPPFDIIISNGGIPLRLDYSITI
ncbi:uncharacterized protein OCT59_023067 [Rhizophagus irregularis]|uniref:uncharacterized protein n=1 Tax=Rhizophagus irregularis TaxID=588596 RepID=UPI003329433E|nr:hypothetical protein OCT59_023067 [Rhizophagus irregularis]